MRNVYFILGFLVLACNQNPTVKAPEDPLPSWNEGTSKKAIVEYVESITDPTNEVYIDPKDRIAVFDNDGTLWSEQPLYFQLFFALDRVRQLAPAHPEWSDMEPYKSILANDMQGVMAGGMEALYALILTAHSGVTTEEFKEIVGDWIRTARHPTLNRPYTDLVFQPMLEVLDYLRANEFKTFIVSGGGLEFMRPWTEEVYGIPPYQMVGSSMKLSWSLDDETPTLNQLPELEFLNDKEAKPIGIEKYIGKRPVIAFGNSDGDLQMLQWTNGNREKTLQVYIHHTDGAREWAYDSVSHIGKLKEGFKAAKAENWTIVSMKDDWKVIYPFELD
jgi:hypothetical protein